MPLFDVYFCIDWSGRGTPSPRRPAADALWVGERSAGGEHSETYYRTRDRCTEALRQRLREHAFAGKRVLVGFDFPLGYPAGLANALGHAEAAAQWLCVWRKLARRIQDDSANGNNRFEVAGELNRRVCGDSDAVGEKPPGPFWGCPRGRSVEGLAPRSPGFPYPLNEMDLLERWRLTDRRVRGVQEAWKLLGTGSVGSQALLGIPRLLQLREDPYLRPFSRVWPFETGFAPRPTPDNGPCILYTEIWPGLVKERLDPTAPIRDQAQVRAVTAWAAEEDAGGDLGKWFDRPTGLAEPEIGAVEKEEGWILGVR